MSVSTIILQVNLSRAADLHCEIIVEYILYVNENHRNTENSNKTISFDFFILL